MKRFIFHLQSVPVVRAAHWFMIRQPTHSNAQMWHLSKLFLKWNNLNTNDWVAAQDLIYKEPHQKKKKWRSWASKSGSSSPWMVSTWRSLWLDRNTDPELRCPSRPAEVSGMKLRDIRLLAADELKLSATERGDNPRAARTSTVTRAPPAPRCVCVPISSVGSFIHSPSFR